MLRTALVVILALAAILSATLLLAQSEQADSADPNLTSPCWSLSIAGREKGGYLVNHCTGEIWAVSGDKMKAVRKE